VTKPTHIIDISSTIDTPKSHFDGKISETTQRKEWKKTTRIQTIDIFTEGVRMVYENLGLSQSRLRFHYNY
jgi:hypothetical protein